MSCEINGEAFGSFSPSAGVANDEEWICIYTEYDQNSGTISRAFGS